MTSQISLSKLMRIDIGSRKWLLVLSSVVQFVLGPIVGLMSLTTKGNYTTQYAIWRAFSYEYSILESVIVIVGAVLVSLVGFRFLFSKKMMDLYGSIPVSRKRMFIAVYLDNILIWAIPFIINMLLTCVLCIAFENSVAGMVLLMAVKYLGTGFFAFLIVYHMCLVAVMISGQPFVAIVNIVMMGLAVIAIYGMAFFYASDYLNTFVRFAISGSDVAWLSPLVAVFYVPGIVNSEYMTGTNYTVFIIGSAILLVLNFFLAGYLYKNRKSELAEGGTKIRAYIIVIRSLAAMVAGVYVSFIFAIMAVGGIHVWSIIGIVIGVVAGFGIINMILHRTGRAFFKDKFIMIGTLAAAILFYLFFAVDLFGYNAYVPAKNHIVKADLLLYGYCDKGKELVVEDGKIVAVDWTAFDELDGYTLKDAGQIHELLSIGSEYAQKHSTLPTSIWESVPEMGYDEDIKTICIQVKVYLSNGTSYYRRYSIDEGTPVIGEIIDSEEYRNENYRISTGNFEILPDAMNFQTGYYEAEDSIELKIENKELIGMILECYRRDFAENSLVGFVEEGFIECEYIVYNKEMEDEIDGNGYVDPFHSYAYGYLGYNSSYIRTNAVKEIINSIRYVDYLSDKDAVMEYIKEQVQALLDAE